MFAKYVFLWGSNPCEFESFTYLLRQLVGLSQCQLSVTLPNGTGSSVAPTPRSGKQSLGLRPYTSTSQQRINFGGPAEVTAAEGHSTM